MIKKRILLCLCLISLGACGKINEDQSADKVQKAIYELAVFEKNYGVLGDAARATIKILQDMTDFSQLEHITLSYACVVFLPDRVIIEVRWIGGVSLTNGLVVKSENDEEYYEFISQGSMTSNKSAIDIYSNFKDEDTIAYSCSIMFRSLNSLPEFLREKRKAIIELTYNHNIVSLPIGIIYYTTDDQIPYIIE